MMPFSLLPQWLQILIKITRVFILIITLCLIKACGEEPVFLGRDLLPPVDNVNVFIDSLSTIQAFSADAKPIITVNNSTYLLGAINDSVFGYSESAIVTQTGLLSFKKLGAGREVDSLFIFLRLSDYYGDSLSVQTLKIFEMTEDIKSDSIYFSNTVIEGQYNPLEIGRKEFIANDTIIKVRINDQSFIDKFHSADDSVFQSNSGLRQVFKGFYFAVESGTEAGGAIVNVNLSSDDSRMVLYYDTLRFQNDTTNMLLNMYFRGEVNSFNVFNNSYENYPPAAVVNNPDSQDTVLFLTSMAGINVHLRFPEFEQWKEKGQISILKAELYAGVEDLAYQWDNKSLYPQNLFLFYINKEGNYEYMYDFKINETNFGGRYIVDEKAYIFNIGYHLQSYISGRIDNFELVLIPEKSNESAQRVLLKSPLAEGGRRMKLKVIYTQL